MRRGQAMTEYVLALAGVLLAAATLGYFVTAAFRCSERNSALVRSEYP